VLFRDLSFARFLFVQFIDRAPFAFQRFSGGDVTV
jgi:hypothetical protein